ncbi:MAG TPA: AAA family ATPase [Nocardioidaceae bacterium]|nr:AAA family ATPase [Nocardioidaceae bacterium]
MGDAWLRDRRPVRRVVASGDQERGRWPATVPAVAQLLDEGLELAPGVTLLVGENGTGKSTIVEAIAMAFGLSSEGGSVHARHSSRATESDLWRWITLERSVGAPKWGFFLRAETMHGFYSYLEDLPPGGSDPVFHELSHGESFLEILRTRFNSPGLYCLDEPEAAMSFSAQLALLGTMQDLASRGGQIVCATHSPLVAALPSATLWELGTWGIRPTTFEELELVAHWKSYLDEPMRYLRHVLED